VQRRFLSPLLTNCLFQASDLRAQIAEASLKDHTTAMADLQQQIASLRQQNVCLCVCVCVCVCVCMCVCLHGFVLRLTPSYQPD
jgi:hypothetical protein